MFLRLRKNLVLIESDVPGDQIDVSRVTIINLFKDTTCNHPLDSWDVPGRIHVWYVWKDLNIIIPLDLGTPPRWSPWIICFIGLNIITLDSWNVSQVKYMEGIFIGSQYNHPLGSWDIRRVKSMEDMFTESQYNHPLDPRTPLRCRPCMVCLGILNI